jgi:hypothetical protein
VVRAFAEAAADGDRDDVWRLLGPKTRERLESDAKRAAELSGQRPPKGMDMLAVGWFRPRFRVDDVKELSRSGDQATVEVRGGKGERETIACVRVGSAWKVELP